MSSLPNGPNSSLKPLKWYKKLAARKGRLEAGVFLVEGDRAVAQIAQNHPDRIVEIITVEGYSHTFNDYPVRNLTEKQFQSICFAERPQGIMAIIRLPRDTYSEELPESLGYKILLLEDVQDPGNVGALIRTAAAFDFSGVILTERCADPFSPKCVQSTAGTVLSLWIRRTATYLESVQKIRQRGFSLIAADIGGTDNPSVLLSWGKLLLALGNEASGLSKSMLDMADCRLRIPIKKEKAESLNVAACGAICMYLSSPIQRQN